MTTKDQERKALAKIKAIVDGLGPDSYLASAFTGAFEIAEQNINLDAAFTLQDHIANTVEEKVAALRKEAEEQLAAAAAQLSEARRLRSEAEEIKKRFDIDRKAWGDVKRSLDWAVHQLTNSLGF